MRRPTILSAGALPARAHQVAVPVVGRGAFGRRRFWSGETATRQHLTESRETGLGRGGFVAFPPLAASSPVYSPVLDASAPGAGAFSMRNAPPTAIDDAPRER